MIRIIIILTLTLIVTDAAQSQSIKTYFPKQKEFTGTIPARNKVWIFLLAGQSNMAGRGLVEPQDTISNTRILTINKDNEIVLAKEPLHYYEPARTGLDCGLSFARTLLESVPKDVSLLIVPTAIGGSSIQRWLADSTWNDVKLLSNAKDKITRAKEVGTFKGILWHQGEANSNSAAETEGHATRLSALADSLRTIIGVKDLPFLVGELGSFSKNPDLFELTNRQLATFATEDKYAALIETSDLPHKGDNLHFDGAAQREMGKRFARAYVSKFLKWARR
jgi:hypothetical protein